MSRKALREACQRLVFISEEVQSTAWKRATALARVKVVVANSSLDEVERAADELSDAIGKYYDAEVRFQAALDGCRAAWEMRADGEEQ